jgi:hypothetical protein
MEPSRLRGALVTWNLILTIGVIALGIAAARSRGGRFTELAAERIDIVDGNGTRRMAITNRDRFPNLVIDGKEGQRSNRAVQPAGIVLYDEQGNEAGGLATTGLPGGAHGSMLVLDYGRSEAIGLVQRRTAGSQETALVLRDPPRPGDPASGGGTPRISVATADRASSIELRDTHGKPRIRLAVDASDRASITFLDPAGEVVQQLPAP